MATSSKFDLDAARLQKAWDDVLRTMDGRTLKKALRKGYRKASNEALRIGRQELQHSGLKVHGNKRDWEKGLRAFIYPNGNGFMVTVKGRKTPERSMHQNARGKKKPVLMWAEDGTKARKRRALKGGKHVGKKTVSTGHMRPYHIVESSAPKMFKRVEDVLFPELEKAVYTTAAKAGLI